VPDLHRDIENEAAFFAHLFPRVVPAHPCGWLDA
jgi:hypothetical protein